MAVKPDHAQPSTRSPAEAPKGKRRAPSWGVAATLLITVALAARLGVPQPVEPTTVPFPEVDREQLARQSAEERALLDVATTEPLPLDVRAVGELMRRLGAAEADADTDQSVALRARLVRQVKRVLTSNQVDAMVRLKALQAHLFAEALRDWDGGSPASLELRELGGSFAQRVQPLRLASQSLPQSEARAAFRVRWTELTGLAEHPRLSATANELRLNARLRLRWATTLSGADRRALELSTIKEIQRWDAEYPAAFASGVAQFRAGAYKQAFDQFSLHLREHPNGPWTLRAQNHATAAAAALVGAR